MNFEVSSSSGNDAYWTNLVFRGNSFNIFSFKFGYLIDLNFNCSLTGDYMHVNTYQCDTVCPPAYYANYTNNTCLPCGVRCYLCTGPSNDECTACYTATQHRVLNGTTCICQNLYYFDNIVSNVCPDCSPSCLTCWSSGNSNCLSCNKSDYRYDDGSNSCPCIIGYVDTGGKTCSICHYSCYSCFALGSSGCLTCHSPQTTYFRNITSNQCLCLTGYFDPGVAICSKCSYKCKTCSGTALTCYTCEATDKRYLAWPNCPCYEGFYDNGFLSMCQPCYFKCKGCNGPAPTDCISCNAASPVFRGLISTVGTCNCLTGYY